MICLSDNTSDTESSDEPPPLPDKCSDYTNVTTNDTPPIPTRATATNRKSKVSFFRHLRNSKAGPSEKEEHLRHKEKQNGKPK
jgi:hypothetical protein